MNTLLIQRVRLDGKETDILIEGNRITRIAPEIAPGDARVIDGSGKAVIPPFYNTHTHAAMTLLRGYADDMELFTWLNDYIWPAEGRLTGEEIYAGTRLALLEMIRSGTVFFNDMYWYQPDAIRAVEEMGMRAAIGLLYISGSDGAVLERNRKCNEELLAWNGGDSGRIQVAHAPHAVYTVSEEVLRRVAQEAQIDGHVIHIHASETAREVEECVAAHGMTPIAYLDSLGILGPRTVLAHAVHLSDEDIEIIRERGAYISHCPCSNFKLASGQFRYRRVVEMGSCRFTIGTDGCASNNNLSMLEEMKFAALSAKNESGSPTAGRDGDIFRAATRTGAEAFGIDAGIIAEGKLADLVLVDLDNPLLVPDFNLTANLVYSADSSCIDTVVCDGRILMENRKISGEAEILAEARRVCAKIRSFREGGAEA
ncbi:amidohydrolase [uncultured Victivallis sp.]|uniref:amidohydrolase n=1 Tax=uncultured Victivallis sp. TaxID=354118 RepID=UPI0025EF5A69|nr:amidohydrolase [uncultured Victivallis sp.]